MSECHIFCSSSDSPCFSQGCCKLSFHFLSPFCQKMYFIRITGRGKEEKAAIGWLVMGEKMGLSVGSLGDWREGRRPPHSTTTSNNPLQIQLLTETLWFSSHNTFINTSLTNVFTEMSTKHPEVNKKAFWFPLQLMQLVLWLPFDTVINEKRPCHWVMQSEAAVSVKVRLYKKRISLQVPVFM